MPVGNPRIKDHSRVPLGSVGESTLRRMVSALVRSMNEPGMSASLKLKLTKEVNSLRVELARMRVERAPPSNTGGSRATISGATRYAWVVFEGGLGGVAVHGRWQQPSTE